MNNDNVFELKNPGMANEVRDVLTEVLREGAQQLLAQAIEVEVAEFLGRYRDAQDDAGRRRIVRNGYLPSRTIQTGIGDVPVKAPRVRDRAGEIRSPRRSCRRIYGARRPSRSCCRGCI